MYTGEITLSHFFLDNQSGKKVRVEVHFNENSKTLTVVLKDRIDTLFIDANPHKKVDIPVKWIIESGDVDDGSESPGTG